MIKKDTNKIKDTKNSKEEIFKEFIDKLISNQHDIPEDIAEIVNKNFRDLIY